MTKTKLSERISPGPWRMHVQASNTTVAGGTRPDPRIAYVYGVFTECPEPEREANAELIAMAPDLLRVSEAMAEALRKMRGSCFSEAESRLSLLSMNAPAMTDPENENAQSLSRRCDNIEQAFNLSEAALAEWEKLKK